ncbi:hypothetical protein C6Y14_09430 [Streptomyces dioscori]|uniref:Uncharacterized protein n=1 Tax=Streptomyces dioscori TaxID=2109333 RepID=A0A2P8QC37_9ACTN|nr:hypothetical protein C6Y14_09430 [Streptomyces dioscori]
MAWVSAEKTERPRSCAASSGSMIGGRLSGPRTRGKTAMLVWVDVPIRMGSAAQDAVDLSWQTTRRTGGSSYLA